VLAGTVLILATVILAVRLTACSVDRDRREAHIGDARLVAQAINVARVRALSGSEADVHSPDYLRLKEQLSHVRAARTGCRFAYLVGKKPDGRLFIYVDSEPAGSKDESPPGQLYTEAPEPLHQVFATGQCAAYGPYTDRWGTWVSAFVPIRGPGAGEVLAVFGMDLDQRTWWAEVIRRSALLVGLVLLTALLSSLLLILRLSRRRIKAEHEAFVQSEERFRDIIFSMADWVWELDENGVYTYSSEKGFELFGPARDDVLGKRPFDFMPADEAERVAPIFAGLVARKAPIRDLENWNIARNGERICLLTNGVPILDQQGNLKGYRGVHKDITRRKHAEEELRLSEARLHAITDSAQDAILIMGHDGCIRFFNRAAERLFGWSGEEVMGKELHGLLAPVRYRAAYAEAARRFSETGDGAAIGKTLELSALRKDGSEFPIEISLSSVKVRGAWQGIGIVRDISQRKQMEEALRASEEKFRQIVDNMGLGVTLIGPDMCIIEMNRQIRQWFPDAKPGDLTACYACIVDPPRRDPCPSCPAVSVFKDGHVHEGTVEIPNKGGVRHLKVTASPIHDRDERVTAVIETIEDVSDRLRLERELNQAQKLESVGRLAAGIAHEINTPVQYVGDNIEFLQIAYGTLIDVAKIFQRLVEHGRARPIPPGLLAEADGLAGSANIDYLAEQVPRAIEQSIEGIGRISTIVQAMKEFSHPGIAEKMDVDLNQCIRSTATVSRNEWKYVADLELELDDALPQVPCLPGEFNQAILNIIVNAAHAIGDVVGSGAEHKGKITISTRRDGAWAEVRIADTGTGIPEEIRARIFDPFFTTKEVGRGTGQGLAIARSVIVDKHGGTISVESEAGQGSVFTIRLPIGE